MTNKKQDQPQPDVVLSDGREIRFDFRKVTRADFRSLFDEEQTQEDEAKILAKASGLSETEINDEMSLFDFRQFARAFFERSRDPLREGDSKN